MAKKLSNKRWLLGKIKSQAGLWGYWLRPQWYLGGMSWKCSDSKRLCSVSDLRLAFSVQLEITALEFITTTKVKWKETSCLSIIVYMYVYIKASSDWSWVSCSEPTIVLGDRELWLTNLFCACSVRQCSSSSEDGIWVRLTGQPQPPTQSHQSIQLALPQIRSVEVLVTQSLSDSLWPDGL